MDSHSLCNETLEIELENGHVLTLYPDDSGILCRMTIEATTVDYETNSNSVPEHRTLKLTFKFDEKLKDRLLNDLRFAESTLSMYGVREVMWRNVAVALVPENELEEQTLMVSSLQQTRRYEDTPRPLKTHLLRDCFRPLTIPLMFFRQGETLYRDFRYVSSFRNFYYLLEGFYAENSHRNQEHAFKANQELVDSVQVALSQLAGGDHETRIYDLLDKHRKPRTSEGVLELLVLLRHNIQHYFHLAKDQRLAEGETAEDFRSAALLAMLVSIQVLWKKVDVLQRKAV